MRLLTGLPRERAPWPARALAVALAAAGPLALVVGLHAPLASPFADDRDPAETIVPLAMPATVPDLVVGERTTPRASAAPAAPTSPGQPRGAPAALRLPPIAGVDSTSPRPSADAPTVRPPTARELFRSPAAGVPMCLPPCGGSGTTVAGSDGVRAGAGVAFPPLTRERRDSIAQAVVAAAAAAGGGTSRPAANLPPGAAGVSIQVGLPGGGPTRAQRERARALDGDVTERLARIRARADSLAQARRRDSVARTMPRRDTTRGVEAPG